MVTSGRTLILLGVTLAAFAAALAAGRALRPAGTPAAASTRNILVQSPAITAAMKRSDRELPPLADPRPRPQEPQREDAPPDAVTPDASEPDSAAQPDATTPPPASPSPVPPTTPISSPQQPAGPTEAPPKGQEDPGGWSSGN